MDYKDFGARIRLVRRERDMTQETLADRVGLSPSFLGHIERGTRVASLETLVALCNALHVTPQFLLFSSLNKAANSSTRSLESLSLDQRINIIDSLRLAEDNEDDDDWYQ